MVTEDRLWEEAWLTVMSEELRPEHYGKDCEEALMLAIEEDNEYLPWEPFEHWDYVALADAIRSFHYQFERLIKEERGE